MLALISPAKKLDFDSPARTLPVTIPDFLNETKILSKVTRKLKAADLKRLMGISDQLAALNVSRFQAFSTPFTLENAKPAILAFNGDTYMGLQAKTLSDDDLAFAQDHLRILSGFYGLLRPLDLIQAYRLEMGIKLATPRGEDLYDFWGNKITNEINKVCKAAGYRAVINLASTEYISAVKTASLKVPMITPVFREVKGGQARILGMMAKRARGAMARFMIVNRLGDPEALKNFNGEGYEFQPDLSDDKKWEFSRFP